MSITVLNGHWVDELKKLPDRSVQCCVTSPPYWGLRSYLPADHPLQSFELGREKTPEDYVEKLVAGFREVRRVLRCDGVFWLNLGDSYNSSSHFTGGGPNSDAGNTVAVVSDERNGVLPTLAAKNLIGIPWRVAFAMQADGWYLRQEIIWHKPSCMPESVTDRCTRAHEYIFMFTKSAKYFYDHEAIKEPSAYPNDNRAGKSYAHHKSAVDEKVGNYLDSGRRAYRMRNKRSVWSVANAGYRGAHFATFPPKLIEPCILAGTSAAGCCAQCGSPLVRQTKSTRSFAKKCPKTEAAHKARGGSGEPVGTAGKAGSSRINPIVETVGWKPSCGCGAAVIPCVVLDPFAGSGTVGEVCNKLGRQAVLIELNDSYLPLIQKRIFTQEKKRPKAQKFLDLFGVEVTV